MSITRCQYRTHLHNHLISQTDNEALQMGKCVSGMIEAKFLAYAT